MSSQRVTIVSLLRTLLVGVIATLSLAIGITPAAKAQQYGTMNVPSDPYYVPFFDPFVTMGPVGDVNWYWDDWYRSQAPCPIISIETYSTPYGTCTVYIFECKVTYSDDCHM